MQHADDDTTMTEQPVHEIAAAAALIASPAAASTAAAPPPAAAAIGAHQRGDGTAADVHSNAAAATAVAPSAAAAASPAQTQPQEPQPATAAAAASALAAAPAAAAAHPSSLSPEAIARILSVVPAPPAYVRPPSAWPLPSVCALAARARTDALIPPPTAHTQRQQGKHTQPFTADEKRDAEWHANLWLLLAANAAIHSLSVKRAEHRPAAQATRIDISDHTRMIETLISACRAKVDYQDEQGFSAVHWLIFDGLESEIGRAECDVDSEGELRVSVAGLSRYSVEHRLRALLLASEDAGYSCWREIDEGDEPRNAGERTLMDLQDRQGNTPLVREGEHCALLSLSCDTLFCAQHWAVNHGRVDLVSMLLLHGAHPAIKNNAQLTPFEMVHWDKKSAETAEGEAAGPAPMDLGAQPKESDEAAAPAASAGAASASRPSVHPLLAHLDTSVYTLSNRRAERRWGLTEGLRIEQCSYAGESDSAAIKRLLFSAQLYSAAESGDYGDAAEVRRLVSAWTAAHAAGARMFPIVFRGDGAWRSPLQTAAVYEDSSTEILRSLLQLPISMHVQPAKAENSALHQAAEAGSTEAVDLLIDAGFNVNFRDVATNVSALSHLCDVTPSEADLAQIDPQELRAFSQRIEAGGRHLMDRGADPRSTDDRGNDCLQLAVFNALPTHLSFVQLLIDRSRAMQADWLQTHVNVFGNAVMHVALYQTFDSDVHVSQLQMLLQAGVPVDAPLNVIHSAPLDVWAGWQSTRAPACAKLMGTTIEAVKTRIKPARVKVPSRVIVPDVLQGNEKVRIAVSSDFDPPSTVLPEDWAYTWEQRAAKGSIAEPFVESLRLNARAGDLGEAARRLNELVTTRDQSPPKLLPLRSFAVRDTQHKGLGLFATQWIKHSNGGSEKGVECLGEMIPRSEAARREVAYMREGAVGFTGQSVLDPISRQPLFIDQWAQGGLFRFINHSCDPNCQVWQMCDGAHAVAYPLRDIKADEELTIDYQLTATRTPRGALICHCGEKSCRKKLI